MFSRQDRDDRAERRWLEAVARGDRRAFERLFQRFERPLLVFFLRMVDDRLAAEELVSDTMFEVWRAAERFAGRSKASTWIFGIAHHKAVDRLRRSAPASEELDETAPDPAGGPEADARAGQHAEAMQEALARLPDGQREVVHLAFYQDLSYGEIGKICKIPENTVKTRMFHAKRKLQPILERMGMAP